jgi:hypothetical protein
MILLLGQGLPGDYPVFSLLHGPWIAVEIEGPDFDPDEINATVKAVARGINFLMALFK